MTARCSTEAACDAPWKNPEVWQFMNNLSPFCTCANMACPLHPTKHERGCAPCIAKNLKLGEIPNCFFNMVDPDNVRPDDKFYDFAQCVMKNRDAQE